MRVSALMAGYAKEAGRARPAGNHAGFLDLLSDLPLWFRTQSGRNALDDGFPWITFAATRSLRKLLSSSARVFEYGSGGSTLFLASRVSRVVSVEHDPIWHAAVLDRLRPTSNVDLLLVPPNDVVDDAGHHGHPAGHCSTDPRYIGRSFCDYASAIDSFPDAYFDVVLVDGRARPSCFDHAVPKLKVGGSLILDNADRDAYAPAFAAATDAGWPCAHHFGPGPYVPYFWDTVIWTKVDRTDA
jgi:hypothetical protein